jgi:hypothetical protein
VPRDDVRAQGQADAVAARFRRRKAVEQAVECVVAHAGPLSMT